MPMVSAAATTMGGFIPPVISTNAPAPAQNGAVNARANTQQDNASFAPGVNTAPRQTDQTSQSQNIQSSNPPQVNRQSARSAQNQSSDPTAGRQELTPEEKEQIRELQARDREVRAHEQAHKTAGGPYASPPSYETVRGPDGRQYAVAGEVKIDSSPENNPEDTIRKMEIVIRAALAPAQASPQDRQVAQQARQQLVQAQAELRQQDSPIQAAAEQSPQRSSLEQIQAQREESDNQTPIEQALARFRQAEQAGGIQSNNASFTQDNFDVSGPDSTNTPENSQEVISALFGAV